MKNLLITGAGPRGVTGKLIKEYFRTKYNVLTPSSIELDLTSDVAVRNYFSHHRIDYVIHCATFRQSSIHSGHFVDEELESNLRMYYNLASMSPKYEKMIYFGSGAEYDKTMPIIDVSEDFFGNSVPKNKYGLGKYIMNIHARKSSNIYNFRLFGTINKYERPDKNVISNLCVKAILGRPLQLRSDCRFSFVDIDDVLPIIDYALEHRLSFHDYNLTNGHPILLSQLGGIIADLATYKGTINFEKKVNSHEYTGSNTRIVNEINISFTDIKKSIEKVYNHYKLLAHTIDINTIDDRWK